ncbi:MAG: hypothetical protein WA052_01095 [Microgenomates group bacterium]
MTRLVFKRGEQNKYLKKVMAILTLNSDGLSKFVGISGRSFRYWISEKTLGSRDAMKKISKISGITLPPILEEREEWWSGRINGPIGTLKRNKLYGPPGNESGRKKGGEMSQKNRKENPDYYRSIGCNVPNIFNFPNESKQLAELFGIVLGDGGLTKYQLTITLNSILDNKYMEYVKDLSEKLFKYSPSLYKYKKANAISLKYSGVNLVKFLNKNGISFGNKSKIQITVPKWITGDINYSTMCLRGLIDTDGGLFEHKYTINGKQYSYLTINFTNVSTPLLTFVFETLTTLGFSPKYQSNNKVWLYKKDEIIRYFKVVGSSNYRLISKLR